MARNQLYQLLPKSVSGDTSDAESRLTPAQREIISKLDASISVHPENGAFAQKKTRVFSNAISKTENHLVKLSHSIGNGIAHMYASSTFHRRLHEGSSKDHLCFQNTFPAFPGSKRVENCSLPVEFVTLRYDFRHLSFLLRNLRAACPSLQLAPVLTCAIVLISVTSDQKYALLDPESKCALMKMF